jgi:dTMP kinase
MLISFVGIDGSGKSTQIEYFQNYLKKCNRDVFFSKAYGPDERKQFEVFIERCSQESVLFIFQALHTEQRIKVVNAINDGKIVIADRWDETYEAYHSTFGILSDKETLRNELNTIAFNNIKPDLTFFIDTPVEVAMSRCSNRGADFFDKKPKEYHENIRNKMAKMAVLYDWVVIDGTKDPLAMHAEIISHAKEFRQNKLVTINYCN